MIIIKMRRFKFEKLIRTKLPDKIRSHGIIVHNPELTATEYVQKLNEKLLEEAQESIKAKSAEELTEELADVLEVIHALGAANKIPFNLIEEKREAKKEERGGFDQTAYVSFIEVEENDPTIEKYLSNPSQYPEID
jgi:predicted house-cleaning noncanonical NTP pyrophosphatase (MazG superfamily)